MICAAVKVVSQSGDLRQCAHGLLEAFDAAEAATGRSGDVTAAFDQRSAARLGEPHP